jgi:hypothetical protein
MSMLRAAYEVFDNTHLSTMKSMIEPYDISSDVFRQLLGNLSLPSMKSEFVKELDALRSLMEEKEPNASWKSEFVYYAVSMCHLFYSKYNPKTGLYALAKDSKPVFYEFCNGPLSYIWLASDAHGMLTCIQSFYATDHMPNVLGITVLRRSKMGSMLPLRFDLDINANKTHRIVALMEVIVDLDKQRVNVKKCDVIFLRRSFALLLSFGMVYNSLQLVCHNEEDDGCGLKQLPVALHLLP